MRVLFILLCVCSAAWSAVPPQMNYQGYLADTDGSPVDTVVSITFNLYDAASGGTQVWTEIQNPCSVRAGLFSVRLGSVEPLPDSIFAQDALWLGVKVGNDSELVPRTFLASVPFAFRSAWADSITPKNAADLLELLNNLPDADQDGHNKPSAGGDDCNDWNATVYPGAPEICDGLDHDCDGIAGEGVNNPGCQYYYADFDGDGHGDEGIFTCRCYPSAPFLVLIGDDCDDNQSSIHPGAAEICNGFDDDCDGVADDSVSAAEICDGLDNDCDEEIDEGENNAGCMDFFFDYDGDGWGTFDSRCLCQEDGYYRAMNPGDCDDENPEINPEMPEVCNGLDDDCDGTADEDDTPGCSLYFWDMDDDDYGTDDPPPRCLCQPEDPWTATQGGDCADGDPAVHPGAIEDCYNSIDDDCDDVVDEATTWYQDADSDDYGSMTIIATQCNQPAGTANNADDCNDSNANIHPGAPENCGNGVDDDCDYLTDGADPDCQ